MTSFEDPEDNSRSTRLSAKARRAEPCHRRSVELEGGSNEGMWNLIKPVGGLSRRAEEKGPLVMFGPVRSAHVFFLYPDTFAIPLQEAVEEGLS